MKEQFYSAIKKDSVYYNASLPFFDSPAGRPRFYENSDTKFARLGFWIKNNKGLDTPRHIMVALGGSIEVLERTRSLFDDKGNIKEGVVLEANVDYSLTKLDRLKSFFADTEIKPKLKSIYVFINHDGKTKYIFKFCGDFDGGNPICERL